VRSRLTVAKYFPDRLYGFLRQADGSEAFFHLGDFSVGAVDEPPPVIGEEVEAEIEARDGERAPKAVKVSRLLPPKLIQGKVDTFSEQKGWGFALSNEGKSYYLHRSEVLGGKLPMAGQRVRFYGGFKNGRLRACYVTIEDRR